MRILIKNCTLVSMSKEKPEYEKNMDILIENENISKIAKNISEKVDRIIDAKRKRSNARFS